MAIDHRCIRCFKNNYDRLLKRYPLSDTQVLDFFVFFNAILDKNNLSSPEIQRELHHRLMEMNGLNDLFVEEKRESNAVAQRLYTHWKPKVVVSDDSFNMSLRLAIAGNIMDFGANHEFDIHKTIDAVMSANFAIDQSQELKKRINEAKSILYLGDNAGEIVFDKLFLETINHPDVTFVVKGGPVINDATLIDAEAAGINSVAKVITNGYDAPSTVLKKSGAEFLSKFVSADLIISKGQGNLEGLIAENDHRIFFLLTVKCDVIAELINVRKGSFVVLNKA